MRAAYTFKNHQKNFTSVFSHENYGVSFFSHYNNLVVLNFREMFPKEVNNGWKWVEFLIKFTN